ncbi:MAG: glycoside hydrolase family 28 protein [Spirochaetes bacterium]|nr:glycoside hydrolase family 28 protein [Spirochaetota bacterium]
MNIQSAVIVFIAAAVCVAAGRYDVTSYGAKGDSTTKDTIAIQKAVDDCASSGGGEVFFPKGRYLSGSIVLKSGVTLFISPDAVLLGSTELSDYTTGKLLFADKAEHIGIEGGGIIDGQGSTFWVKKKEVYSGTAWRGTAQFNYQAQKRPSFIHLVKCSGVSIRNITLTNSASWTVHLQRCTNVKADGVTIRNFLYGPNTDGFDVNSCVDVSIMNCDIITGDDGIVLKSTEPGHDHPSKNITAANCRIWSACNGLKIGTETHGSFENIVFRDCFLYSASGDPLDRTLAAVAIESVDGANLNGIYVSNISISNVKTPLFVRLGHRGGNSEKTKQVDPNVPGTIRNVVIAGITAVRSMFESSITGIPSHPVQGITLSNIQLEYEGGGGADLADCEVPDEAVIRHYPEAQMFGRLPAYGLYCRHVDGIRISGLSFRTLAKDERPAFICDDVKRIDLSGFTAGGSTGQFPVIRFLHVSDASVTRSSAPAGTKLFLAIEDDADDAQQVSFDGTGMKNASQAFAHMKPGALFSADTPLIGAKVNGAVLIEAHRMKLSAPMTVVEDGSVPTGKYIEVPLKGGRDRGNAVARFELASDGDYLIQVLVFSPTAESDTFYASIDGGKPALSDVLEKNAWRWDFVRDRVNDKPVPESKMTYRLTKGTHTLKIQNREDGTRIAALVIIRTDAAVDAADVLK